MNDHDRLIRIDETLQHVRGDMGNIKKDLAEGREKFKYQDKRIRKLEQAVAVIGAVWVLAVTAGGWLYKAVLGVK